MAQSITMNRLYRTIGVKRNTPLVWVLTIPLVVSLLLAATAQAQTADQQRTRPSGAVQQRLVPGMATYTDEVLYGDVWRRPELSPRDRSLVTIAALAAMGDDDQLDLYLLRGVESGLTRDQIAEALIHLAFYAGWFKATKAMTVFARR